MADDIDPLQGIDIGVEVGHLDPQVLEILGQVLRHPLGEGGDQDPLPRLGAFPDLPREVVHLVLGGPDDDLGVHQPRGTDDLLHHVFARLFQLVVRRRGRHVDDLPHRRLELLEVQRPVVQGGGQAEPVFHEGLLPAPVAEKHAPDLGDGHVALVDHDEGVGRQVAEQRRRGIPRPPSRQVAGVVLDPLAVADLLHHLQVIEGALLDPLGLDQFVLGLEKGDPLGQLLPDGLDGLLARHPGRDVVAGGKDGHPLQRFQALARQGIDLVEAVHLVAEQLDSDGPFVFMGGNHLDHVPPHAEIPADEVVVVAHVVNLHQLL